MRNANIYLTVTGCRIKETEKAILFRIHKIRETVISPKEEWFPKSQIVKSSISGPGEDQDTSWLMVSEWIMEQKSLIETSPSPSTESPYKQKNQNEPYYPTPSPNIKASFDSYISNESDIPF